MGWRQRPFRSRATDVPQPAVQLPAETHDTTTLPFLLLAGSWIARPHRPFISLTTNGGRLPPAAQFPRAGHDRELTPVITDDIVLALKTVMKRPHLPFRSLVPQA